MEKLVVIVVDSDAKALKGLEALRELDRRGEISLYEAQVVSREPNGSLRVIENVQLAGLAKPLGGTVIGALVGLLGGPLGVVIGSSSGMLIGAISEARAEGVTDEFVKDIEFALTPGKTAVLASISEDWTGLLDTEVDQLGGVIFRRIRTYEKERQEDLDAAAHQAEIEQLTAERARARSERLAKIDDKIDRLRAKLEAAVERKRLSMRKREQERDAKVAALQAKADQSKEEIRRRHEARIAELQHDYAEEVAGV